MKRGPLVRTQPEARASVPILRPKKCKGCGEKFRPLRPMQAACGIECARTVGAEKLSRDQAKADAKRLQALKPRSYWLKRAQAACNAYIRARDKDQPCISCSTLTAEAWHAGHYYSTAARPDLRFDEANIHRQCVACNLHKHGNLIEYRRNLAARIGQEVLDRLDGPPVAVRATVEVLQALAGEYRAKAKELDI